MRRILVAAAFAAAFILSTASHAKTLRWASQGGISTLDPHAHNEALVLTAFSYLYEPLVGYAPDNKIEPRLATSWQRITPTTWRFSLRPGVKFHDGTPFTADDVVFSIQRAKAPTSDFKLYVDSIIDVRQVDDLTVDIMTRSPNPILLRQLPNVFIMSRLWAERHDTRLPQDFSHGPDTYATRHANGTGPYQLESYEPDVRTVFIENTVWWNQSRKIGNVRKVVYTPIKDDTARVMALLSDDIDFVLDPAAQFLGRLRQQAKVVDGNEYRTIFLGLDQQSPELKYANIRGRNPFADVRVREALYRAIDINSIKKSVMRDSAIPTGTMIAPQVHGWTPMLAKRVSYDPEKARELLKAAGYDNNLRFALDCPNDRYSNDEAICQAIVKMWGRVGVTATLRTLPRAAYFPKVLSGDTSAYMLGLGVPTYDALYVLQSLIHSKGEGADGAYNVGGYANPEVDALIDQIKVELDPDKRLAAIHKVLAVHAREFGHLPLHVQLRPWAMRKNVHAIHRADNRLVAAWVVID